MERNKREFILTLNGKRFTFSEDGNFAIATDGRMIGLQAREKESRFR